MPPQIPIVGTPTRVTMFMNRGNTTIAETHWTQLPIGPTLANPAATALAKARAKLLGSDATMLLSRMSLDNVFRDSSVIDTSLVVPPTANGACDPRDRCDRVRLEAGSLYRKTLYLGLIPDDTVVNSKFKPTSVAGYQKAYFAYLNLLGIAGTSNPSIWGMLSVNKDQTACPVVNVKNVAVTGPAPLVTYTTVKPHNLAVGDVVRVQRTATQAGIVLNPVGLFKVVTVPGVTSFVVANAAVTVPLTFSRGTAQKKQRIYVPYSDWDDRGLGFHKRGGRVFLPLGRQRTQK